MRVERIVAPSVAAALQEVRRRLGPDAAILSTSTYQPPRWKFWEPQGVVVVAADRLPVADTSPELAQLRSQVRELARELERMREAWGGASEAGRAAGAPLDQVRARLMERGADASLAEEIAQGAGEVDGPTWEEKAVTALARWLEPRVDRRPHLPRTVVLVGPTGAGKTTTLAKMAARAVLERGEKVGVVTCDTYRIAAVDQLRTYADILGVPLRIAVTPDDLEKATREMADMDRVFVDTPGRNFRLPMAVMELSQLIRRASPDAVDLVVPATMSPADAQDLCQSFQSQGLATRCVLSKWDETRSPGAALLALRALDRPLSCVTTGQMVPDDLAYPDAQRLARAVWEGGELM